MDPRHLFMDSRLSSSGTCVYCGTASESRDHVPSKVLLDKPYPEHLPVVEACEKCNASFSLDEQYLACFIECVICGTVEPAGLQRTKIKRLLSDNLALRQRIADSQIREQGNKIVWLPEVTRVRNIVSKLAIGHVAYELYPRRDKPKRISFAPFSTLSNTEQNAFEDKPFRDVDVYPEIGTRAFIRSSIVTTSCTHEKPVAFVNNWIEVQEGRYRYTVIENGLLLVRIVLSEYLACEVLWGNPE